MNGIPAEDNLFDPLVRETLFDTSPLFLELVDKIIGARVLSQDTFKPNTLASVQFNPIYAKDFSGSFSVELMTVTPTAALFKHTKVSIYF
jgi:hypothetical protein